MAPSSGTSATYPSNPALAFGAGVYLMAWVDERLDVDSQVGDVFLARFSEAGQPLDGHPIAVGVGLQHETLPSIAFDGTNFLVAWFRYGIPPYNGGGDAVGVRVTPSGEVLDGEPFVVVPGGYAPAVVSGGPGWMVVTADPSTDSTLTLAKVDPNATVHLGAPLQAQPDSYGWAATSSDTLLVVGRTNATLIDVNANSLRPVNPQHGPGSPPGVTWNGSAYYLAAPAVSGVSLTKITKTGAATSAVLPATLGYGPVVAASEDVALVAYSSNTGEVRAQFAPLPSMQSSSEFVVDPTQTQSNIDSRLATTRGSNGFGLGWIGSSGDALVSLVPKFATLSGTDGGGVATTSPPLGSADQLSPAVADDDAGFSLVWSEATSTDSKVLLMRFDPSGAARDSSPIVVAKGRNPTVARRAGRTMMFWEDFPFVLGARIDDSEVLPHLEERPDSAGLHNLISDISFSSPTVVATSNGFAVQYATHTDSAPDIWIYHVDPAWPDVPIQATGPAGSVASGGFVFAEGTTDSDKQAQGPIHLLIEHQPTLLSIDVSTALDGAEPSVARGGDRVLVAYRQGSQDEPKRIRVQAFDATTGSPVGPTASDLFPDEKHCDRPSVTFDGQNFWVAFRRADGGRGDLLGARVSPNGAVLERPFVISDDPETELSTAIAGSASGRVLIAYSRFDRVAAGARLKVRWGLRQ